MYNKEISRRVAGAKNNTFLDAFKSALLNLLKLKKYKDLVADEDSGHTAHTASLITKKDLDPTNSDRSSMQIDGHGQKDVPSINDQPRQLPNQHQQS